MEKPSLIEKSINNVDVTIDKVSSTVLTTSNKSIKKGKPVIKETDKLGKMAAWGLNNLFPNEVIDDLRKSDLLAPVRERKIEMLYSGGLRYGLMEGEGENRKLVPKNIPEIDEFLRNSNINAYCKDALSDHFTFYNFFPRIRKNLGKSKIVRLEVSDAVHTRLSLQDKNGDIKQAYVNANWKLGRAYNSPDTLTIDALNPYFDVVQQLRESKSSDFIAPIRQQRDGNIYYDIAPWNAIRSIGWLDVAYFVPQFKKFLMENIMKTKILISVDPEYWTTVYNDWKNMSKADKTKAKQELIDKVVEHTKSDENAGGTLTLPKVWDREAKAYRDYVTINPLKLNFESGTYNEDSQEADAHIYRAWGLQGSLIGMTPGKNHNAGSGSDQRVARNNFVLDNKIHMDTVLQPLEWIAEFNGWNNKYGTDDSKLYFFFHNYFTATLNSGAEVQTTIEKAHGDS